MDVRNFPSILSFIPFHQNSWLLKVVQKVRFPLRSMPFGMISIEHEIQPK